MLFEGDWIKCGDDGLNTEGGGTGEGFISSVLSREFSAGRLGLSLDPIL
jgi:hypothetical protein